MFPALQQLLDQQKWLDTLGAPLQQYINDLFSNAGPDGKRIQNFLNGTWLGHPLHPVITDVPVGAWTCTLILDRVAAASDNPAFGTASDLALATGLASAVGSAATGLTDWKDTWGEERKVGLAHGAMMVSATALYALSLLARVSGARKTGVALSNLGYGVVAAGAYLGGDEVYGIGYPVNHTAFQHGPGEFVEVMKESDVRPDMIYKVRAGDVDVLLARHGGELYALDDTCVHAGCSLADGKLDGRSVICPCHGSQYDLADGSVINGPATMPEPIYEVRVENGMVAVKAL